VKERRISGALVIGIEADKLKASVFSCSVKDSGASF
jgi:hypothetical protein